MDTTSNETIVTGGSFVGYEDSQTIRRIFAVIPVHGWHTSHLAFFQTAGSNPYRGAWVPSIGLLHEPIAELRMDVGHIVKMGHVNDVLKRRHMPAWIEVWLADLQFFGLLPFLELSLQEIQLKIQDFSTEELRQTIALVREFDSRFDFLHPYFLTWSQLQVSAQLECVPAKGFWSVYPDLREFVLNNDWDPVGRVFVPRANPITEVIRVSPSDVENIRYSTSAEDVNAELANYDAYLDGNLLYQSFVEGRPESLQWKELYPPASPSWVSYKRKVDAMHLYLQNRATLLWKNPQNVFG